MTDIIYKTVKPSHLKHCKPHKIKKPNVPSHFHIFSLNLDKANHSFLHPFLLLRETDFRKNGGCGGVRHE